MDAFPRATISSAMTDDDSDLQPIDLAADPTRETPVGSTAEMTTPMPAPPTADTTWPPGWYSDPWTAGQYRYWTGTTWTGETNRWGPTNAGGAAAWPAVSSPVTSGYGLPTGEAPADAPPARPTRRGPVIAGVIALVLLVAASATVGYIIDSRSRSKSSADNTAPTTPGTTTPGGGTTPGSAPASTDPDRLVLGGLVVQQSDVGAKRTVVLIPNGASTAKPTLDLCNGDYPSERLRTARLQVATADAAGNTALSTEAVLYKNPAAAAQAMRELVAVRASCPHKPVASPVGEGTAQTEFKPAPDASWPRNPAVQRQAYSMITTAAGQSHASIAVYLRRGRALLGIYFLQPNGVQPSVAGERSIANIVAVFEARLARLAPAVVNRRG
jgi:hypothetical protein